jgi:hypothetical protein
MLCVCIKYLAWLAASSAVCGLLLPKICTTARFTTWSASKDIANSLYFMFVPSS